MPPASLPRARNLVMLFGWNATAYQILNPGMQHWFSRAGNAVVGYVQYRRVRVVAGAPVCAAEQLAAVAAEFEADARDCGEKVCYVCAEARVESLYRGREGYSRVLLGAQPIWDPQRWPTIIAQKASLRAQLNRARNKGVVIEDWPIARAENDPGLHHCLEEWLGMRGLPALHFLVEPETLARLTDRRVFVARRREEVVGFLIASPIPQRRGWLIEQNLRGVPAPNGTTELLLDVAVRALANDGAEFVTLGLAPLSTKGHPEQEANPIWLRGLLAWLRAHGRRFYNFRGLEHFKAKFEPAGWDPVYAIVNEPRFAPSTLYAIAAAFSNGSPVKLLARGLTKAIRTEIGWLFADRSR
jgi:phosphatidylglycerol lysyltransferase